MVNLLLGHLILLQHWLRGMGEGVAAGKYRVGKFSVTVIRTTLAYLLPLAAPRQQRMQFRLRQIAPLSDLQLAELDIDDAHALQTPHLVAEHLAHAADLPVQSLGEDDAEHVLADASYLAGLGGGIENPHTLRHAVEEHLGDGLVDGDNIFLFVIVLGTQDLVDDIAVAGEQDQTVRVLVEAADGKDALAVPDEIDDVALDVSLGGAGHACRFVKADVDLLFFLRADHPLVDPHLVAVIDLAAELRAHAVDRDPALGNPGIRLAPRAQTGLADVFIQSH